LRGRRRRRRRRWWWWWWLAGVFSFVANVASIAWRTGRNTSFVGVARFNAVAKLPVICAILVIGRRPANTRHAGIVGAGDAVITVRIEAANAAVEILITGGE